MANDPGSTDLKPFINRLGYYVNRVGHYGLYASAVLVVLWFLYIVGLLFYGSFYGTNSPGNNVEFLLVFSGIGLGIFISSAIPFFLIKLMGDLIEEYDRKIALKFSTIVDGINVMLPKGYNLPRARTALWLLIGIILLTVFLNVIDAYLR